MKWIVSGAEGIFEVHTIFDILLLHITNPDSFSAHRRAIPRFLELLQEMADQEGARVYHPALKDSESVDKGALSHFQGKTQGTT